MATIEEVLGTVDSNVEFIKGFFNDPASAAGIFSKESLKKLAKLVGEILKDLIAAFVDAINGAAEGIGEALRKAAETLADFWEKIVKFFQDALGNSFPSPLKLGPVAAINSAVELTSLIGTLGPSTNVSDRIDIVADSIFELIELAGKKGDLNIISEAIGTMKKLLRSLTSAGSAETKVKDLLVNLLVPQKTQLVKLLKSIGGRKWWAWAEMPGGLVPGKLHEWVNDRSSYRKFDDNNQNPSPMDPKLIPLARQFRCQVVMVLDGYLRSQVSQTNIANPLTNSDGRMSFQSLTDLICGLVDKTVGFVFEPEDFPAREDDLDGFEDIGLGFAVSFARQIRVAIRGTIGLLFRGVWEYSLHSDALIELFASVVGVTLSSIFESVLRNLTWSLRLVSRYKGDPHGGQAGFAIPTLDRSSPVTGSGTVAQEVEYVAFIRSKGLIATPFALGGFLQGLMRDLAAYTDACYLQFRTERKFPGLSTDNVGGLTPTISGKKFTLFANVNASGDEFGDLPRPVLRAYFGNQMVVMAPGPSPTDNYEMEFEFKRPPRRNFEVTVLSSRGGLATQIVTV